MGAALAMAQVLGVNAPISTKLLPEIEAVMVRLLNEQLEGSPPPPAQPTSVRWTICGFWSISARSTRAGPSELRRHAPKSGARPSSPRCCERIRIGRAPCASGSPVPPARAAQSRALCQALHRGHAPALPSGPFSMLVNASLISSSCSLRQGPRPVASQLPSRPVSGSPSRSLRRP